MRLTEHERDILVDAIRAADPDAQIWLHGSRVHDDARGGDIDLLVLSQRIQLSDKLDVLVRLHRQLGDQRIDLTVARDEQRPFVRIAKATGVQLR